LTLRGFGRIERHNSTTAALADFPDPGVKRFEDVLKELNSDNGASHSAGLAGEAGAGVGATAVGSAVPHGSDLASRVAFMGHGHTIDSPIRQQSRRGPDQSATISHGRESQ